MAHISESGEVTIVTKSQAEWDNMMASVKADGMRKASEFKEQGRGFIVDVLAPNEVQGGTKVDMTGLVLPLDWKVGIRMEMAELARLFITKAYMLGVANENLTEALATAIEGRSSRRRLSEDVVE